MIERTPKQASPPSTQSGFTIIECLLAIILVGILMTAIAPVIVLSVATRLQARRVELASQAARDYIEGVRSGKINVPNNIVPLAEVTQVKQSGITTNTFTPKRDKFSQNTAPRNANPLDCSVTTSTYCRNPPNPSDTLLSLYCVNLDGNGCNPSNSRNFVIQAFRSTPANQSNPDIPANPNDDGSNGYILGVRVYRADGFDGSGPLQRMVDRLDANGNAQKVATYTGGRGNRQAPLVEMTTEISGSGTDYNTLCDRLGGCNK